MRAGRTAYPRGILIFEVERIAPPALSGDGGANERVPGQKPARESENVPVP